MLLLDEVVDVPLFGSLPPQSRGVDDLVVHTTLTLHLQQKRSSICIFGRPIYNICTVFYIHSCTLLVGHDELDSLLSMVFHLDAVNAGRVAACTDGIVGIAVRGHDAGVGVKKSHLFGVAGSREDAVLAVGVGAVVVRLVGHKGRVCKGDYRFD